MVIKQGQIINSDFNPALGDEQQGYRPAVVISNNVYNKNTNLLIVLPITNTKRNFPLHIPLDNRTQTTGVILCEHLKSIDKTVRDIKIIETLREDILKHVLAMVRGEIEMR